MSALRIKIGELSLANPVMSASGTFGYGREFEPFVELDRLGAIIVKGLSLEPTPGNPPPRTVETACGLLNAIGLENIGVEAFIREALPFLSTRSPLVLANIYGQRTADYAQLAERLDDLEAVHGLEVNISCPNVKTGGIAFGVDPEAAAGVVRAVRANTGKHLMVKLSPNVTDIAMIARRVEDAGADSISLINTLTGMAVDVASRRPKLANVTGGLSGPAIKPVALRMVWETARQVNIPVIGIGGIMTAEDALEFLIAGAAAVQVGTANLVNPGACREIIDGLEQFVADNHLDSITDIIGSLAV